MPATEPGENLVGDLFTASAITSIGRCGPISSTKVRLQMKAMFISPKPPAAWSQDRRSGDRDVPFVGAQARPHSCLLRLGCSGLWNPGRCPSLGKRSGKIGGRCSTSTRFVGHYRWASLLRLCEGSRLVDHNQSENQPHRISAKDARGGEIILRTRRRRLIFIGGLVGIVLLVLIVQFAASV